MYALLDARDRNHNAAARVFADLLEAGDLLTHNYVVVETVALTQHRLGLDAVRGLDSGLLPAITLAWVEPSTHRAALSAVMVSGQRRVSLVDRVSFEVMREHDISRAFAFDEDFESEGFATVP